MKYYKNKENKIFAFEQDGSQDHLIEKDFIEITFDEINELNKNEQKNNFNALGYEEKRKIFYPSIESQLDILYHGGYDAWKASIEAVKNQFPKP